MAAHNRGKTRTSCAKLLGKSIVLVPNILVSSAIVLLFAAMITPVQNTNSQNNVALVGGTIYISPTQDPITNGVVLIQDDKITAAGPRAEIKIPQGAQVVDCAGRTITAGFWNSHVHFM